MSQAVRDLIMQALKILETYQQELNQMMLKPYPERDQDFQIIKALLAEVNQSINLLNNQAQEAKAKEAIDHVMHAFDAAEENKMHLEIEAFISKAKAEGKILTDAQLEKIREQGMRQDSWQHWMLLSTGQFALKDVLLEFRQEARQTLPMIASAIQATHRAE